jgi:hypothetical protein
MNGREDAVELLEHAEQRDVGLGRICSGMTEAPTLEELKLFPILSSWFQRRLIASHILIASASTAQNPRTTELQGL